MRLRPTISSQQDHEVKIRPGSEDGRWKMPISGVSNLAYVTDPSLQPVKRRKDIVKNSKPEMGLQVVCDKRVQGFLSDTSVKTVQILFASSSSSHA